LSNRRSNLGIVLLLALTLVCSAPVSSAWAEEAPAAIPCEGDECQGPPPAPDDPTPGTAVVVGPQNPPVHFPGHRPHKKPGHKKHGTKRPGR
jgi:hypothetical protein